MTNICPFKANNGWIVVEPLEQYQSTSRISIAESVKDPESQRLAKVVSVGGAGYNRQGGVLVDPPCKVGDVIVHQQFKYDNFKYKNIPYKFIQFEDVEAVLNE
jgi:co-chaperonin GroES (HSP10)